MESFLRMVNPHSILTEDDLALIRVYALVSAGNPLADAEWDASVFGIDSGCRQGGRRPNGKELRKPPPKALLFEAKLKRLLTKPN
ncbi:hypothetical protein TIFTF001_034000 [Ficus carica]|uniref:Uncharacterized protein n=1 Tax=Ficus carica TaxID=3494 RepID=A0AA88DZR7_FICCA|nr:hypothetical protein TIFTF001_034000 [Ficus carica]